MGSEGERRERRGVKGVKGAKGSEGSKGEQRERRERRERREQTSHLVKLSLPDILYFWFSRGISPENNRPEAEFTDLLNQ